MLTRTNRQEIQCKFFYCRLHFHFLVHRLLVISNKACRATAGQGRKTWGPLEWLFFFSINHAQPNKSEPQKDHGAPLPLLLIMIVLSVGKNHIASKSKSNSRVCERVSVWLLPVGRLKKQLKPVVCFCDSLQHFRWGYGCHVQATSQQCVPEIICLNSEFQNKTLGVAAPWKINTCAQVASWRFGSITLMPCFSVGCLWHGNILRCCT